MTQNCPIFRMNIWFLIFCQIFAKLFIKKHKGGSNKYEIWHVRQLDHAEKKVQKSFFVKFDFPGNCCWAAFAILAMFYFNERQLSLYTSCFILQTNEIPLRHLSLVMID